MRLVAKPVLLSFKIVADVLKSGSGIRWFRRQAIRLARVAAPRMAGADS